MYVYYVYLLCIYNTYSEYFENIYMYTFILYKNMYLLVL